MRDIENLGSRVWGVDALRVVAMMMIVGLHYLLFGGVLDHTSGVNRWFAWFVESLLFIAVDIYVLISGYFLVMQRKFRLKPLAKIWVQAFFYSVLFYAWHVYAMGGGIQLRELLRALFPVRYGLYWFVTAYVGMFLLSPFLARLAQSLSRREYWRFLMVMTAAFSFYSFFRPESDPFKMVGGYCVFWFIVLFFWGGYIRLWGISVGKAKAWWVYVMASVATFLLSIPVEWILHAEGFKVKTLGIQGFYQYNSPTVLLAALALFLFFLQTEKPHGFIGRAISWMAPLTFGVYLIHENAYIRKELWYHWISTGTACESSVWYLAMHMAVTVIGVFLACILIDAVRAKLFRLLSPAADVVWNRLAGTCAAWYLKWEERWIGKDE